MCNVSYVRNENNHADVFTNLTKQCPPIHSILSENVADLPMEQWVYCTQNDSRDLNA